MLDFHPHSRFIKTVNLSKEDSKINSEGGIQKPLFNEPQNLITRYWLGFGGALIILASSLFIITPFLNRLWGEVAGNSAYMILRFIAWMALGYTFTRWAKRSRFQAIITTVIISMIDSVVFKGIALLHDRRLHPENWTGIEPSTLLFGLSMSSVLFLPIVLMLSFMGCLIGTKADSQRLS